MDVAWPQLLRDYGPFALLPFFLIVERTAARRAHDATLPERTRNNAYAVAWITIFVLSLVVVVFWALPKTRDEGMVRGRIDGLWVSQRLRGTGPETDNVRVFTYRDPQQTDQVFWRIYTAGEVRKPADLAFLIDSSTDNSDDIWSYAFRLDPAYYKDGLDLHLQYDPAQKTLSFDNPSTGKREELSGHRVLVAAGAVGERNARRLPWFAPVFAQSKGSPEMVIGNLEADDPLIRLTARKQLAAFGPGAAGAMEKVLVKPESTYRAKLGVIVAANQMAGFRPDDFNASAWCEVWRDAQNGDDAMKAQAGLLLKKQSKPVTASSCAAMQRQPALRTTAAPKSGKSK